MKEFQRSVGKEMAIADFIKMPERDPMELLETCTEHDTWMASFERAFISQWKVESRKANGGM